MDILVQFADTLLTQLQKPTLAFLLGGMMLAALGSKLEVPDQVYRFIVLVLLLKVGLGAGMSMREAEFTALAVPALCAALAGVAIVLIGGRTLGRMAGVSHMDAMATVGLFGAVSASTLAAGMAMLDDAGVAYEGFIGALYPFMDVAALVTAIVLARLAAERREARTLVAQGGGTIALGGGGGTGGGSGPVEGAPCETAGGLVRSILVDTLRSPAISALLLGLAIGLFAQPQSVFEQFYEPLFRGLLSILMLVMGLEAWARLSQLRGVAHAYVGYALVGPIVHGLIGIGLGLVAHHLAGLSAGGVVLLAVMAASSSDISGPPTMRGALPEANPSAYVGCSTGLGTPVAILAIPLWMALVEMLIGL